jgi:tRNA pseudouridine65 synthase
MDIFSHLHRNVRLIKMHPCGIIGLNKPSKILSHPNSQKDMNQSIFRDITYNSQDECFRFNGIQELSQNIYLLHRLDKLTSGVLLLSFNKKLKNFMNKQFRQRQIHKQYRALVFQRNKPFKKIEIWRDSLNQNSDAETEVEFLNFDSYNSISEILLKPHTGFKHQLRIQCANRGFPIIGDDLYGDFHQNRSWVQSHPQLPKRLFLHAHKISFAIPTDDTNDTRSNREIIDFEAPLPEEFSSFHKSNDP